MDKPVYASAQDLMAMPGLEAMRALIAGAGHATLPAGVGYGTVETKVNFVRAIKATTGAPKAGCWRKGDGRER